MNWRDFFKAWGSRTALDVAPGIRATTEEQYQAFRARLIEELGIPLPETPEERAQWVKDMVRATAAPEQVPEQFSVKIKIQEPEIQYQCLRCYPPCFKPIGHK